MDDREMGDRDMADGFAGVPLQPDLEEKAGGVATEVVEVGAEVGETAVGTGGAWGGLPSWEEAADIWREVWIEEVHHSTGLGGNSLSRNEVERLLADGRAVGSRLLVEYLYVRGYGDASRWVCQQVLVSQFWNAEALDGEGITGRLERENGELGQEKIGVREQSETQDEFAEPKSLVTLEEICFLHEQTTRLSSVATHKTASSPEEPGRFREHEFQASAEGITPVSWRFVPAEMEKWLTQANELAAAATLAVSEKQEVVQKSAVAQAIQELSEERAVQKLPEPRAIQELAETLARIHSRFVKTQPFATANGLVARLATNLLLIRRGLPPAIIQKRQRSAYQQALQRADLGNFAQLADLFAQGIFRSLVWFAQPEPEEGLVPLSALATEEINVAALRVAAARGRLRAKRPPGGRWLSTSEWVADYIATRHQRT